jgi:hypothetical protein
MSTTVGDCQGIGTKPQTGKRKRVDPIAFFAVLVILTAISTLVLVVYSIRNAYDTLPDRLHVNTLTARQDG